MTIVIVSKAQLARDLGVTPARVSQYIARGLPVLDTGKIELGLAIRWLKSSTCPSKSRHPDRGCNELAKLEQIFASSPNIF
jgi:hypothetical protein